MGTALAMKTRIEPETKPRTFTLTIPKGRRGQCFREWAILQLVHLGFETVGVENYCFGKFPETVTIRPYVTTEIEERMELLHRFCKMLNIRIVDFPLEAVK